MIEEIVVMQAPEIVEVEMMALRSVRLAAIEGYISFAALSHKISI